MIIDILYVKSFEQPDSSGVSVGIYTTFQHSVLETSENIAVISSSAAPQPHSVSSNRLEDLIVLGLFILDLHC